MKYSQEPMKMTVYDISVKLHHEQSYKNPSEFDRVLYGFVSIYKNWKKYLTRDDP